jgi:glycosyltransferase involved in cell wall biosynthesis
MARQKILIDGYNLGLETGTGVATYARNLSFCAHDLDYDVDILYGTRSAPFQKLLREIAFFDSQVGKPQKFWQIVQAIQDIAAAPVGLRARSVPITGRVIIKTFKSRLPYYDRLWNVPNLFNRANDQFGFLKKRLKVYVPSRPNLVHWTYPLPLQVVGAKNIYTMHDLVPLRLPYTTLDIKRRYFNLSRMLAKRGDHIVTVSECSKRDIVNLLGIPERKVTNTYQAVDIPAKYADKSPELVKREVEGTFNLPYKGYMLFFGAIEPKKNVGRLIEGYLGSKIETPLVLVGKLAWKSEQELKLMSDDVLRYLETINQFTFSRQRIQHIDYAPFPILVSLIKGAKAVLFPSLYEGFGLPALEAMLLGTPVLTSTEGSMPEVVGDGALTVDPYDSLAIAEGIRALDGNAELRGDLVARGLVRAREFSPDAYKRRLSELYKRLI